MFELDILSVIGLTLVFSFLCFLLYMSGQEQDAEFRSHCETQARLKEAEQKLESYRMAE